MPQPLALDTSRDAEARQITVMQQRTPAERLALMFDLSAFALASSRRAIRRAHPYLSQLEQARMLMRLLYDQHRAEQVQQIPMIEGMMTFPTAIMPIVRVCDHLGVPYYLTGSIASTAYSLPRMTYDVDMVARLQPQHAPVFVQGLSDAYYVDLTAILDAIAHRSSFNMLHHASGINIDIFIPGEHPFDHVQFTRVQAHVLPGAEQAVYLASPEDIVLNKLTWYELGNRVSDQQWRDVQGILRVQGAALDQEYLRRWAAELQLSALLEAALRGERPIAPASGDAEQQRLF